MCGRFGIRAGRREGIRWRSGGRAGCRQADGGGPAGRCPAPRGKARAARARAPWNAPRAGAPTTAARRRARVAGSRDGRWGSAGTGASSPNPARSGRSERHCLAPPRGRRAGRPTRVPGLPRDGVRRRTRTWPRTSGGPSRPGRSAHVDHGPALRRVPELVVPYRAASATRTRHGGSRSWSRRPEPHAGTGPEGARRIGSIVMRTTARSRVERPRRGLRREWRT